MNNNKQLLVLRVQSNQLWTLLIATFMALILIAWVVDTTKPIIVRLEPQSKLYLKGNSNVTAFNCFATDMDPQFRLDVKQQPSDTTRYQLHARFKIVVAKLDCGREAINHDLQNALTCDAFPYIYVDLLEARIAPGGIAEQWSKVTLFLRLEVAGQVRREHIVLNVRKTAPQQYQLIGRCPLQMTDFGITPPSALFGMVQVEDLIDIHFDLSVCQP